MIKGVAIVPWLDRWMVSGMLAGYPWINRWSHLSGCPWINRWSHLSGCPFFDRWRSPSRCGRWNYYPMISGRRGVPLFHRWWYLAVGGKRKVFTM